MGVLGKNKAVPLFMKGLGKTVANFLLPGTGLGFRDRGRDPWLSKSRWVLLRGPLSPYSPGI